MGPLLPIRRVKQQILIIFDQFTKVVEAESIKSQGAETAALIFLIC